MFRKIFFVTMIVAVVGFFYLWKPWQSKAALIYFYPHSCLGGWLNPQNAEGVPDVKNKDDLEGFTSANSAILKSDISADIFCGGFDADIPPDSLPKKAVLTLSWNILGKKEEPKPEQSLVSEPETQDASAIEAVTEIMNEHVSVPESKPVVSEPVVPKPVIEQAPIQESEPAVESSAEPVSFIKKAWAEEIFQVPVDNTDTNIVEVSYTLNGSEWIVLGKTDKARLHYQTFQIPLTEKTTWEDVKNIQISIKKLTSIDVVPDIYLDAMTLEVEYGSTAKEPTQSGLYFTNAAAAASSSIQFYIRDNENRQDLVIHDGSAIKGVAIYGLDSGKLLLTTFVEGDTYILQPEYFGVGKFEFITTDDPNTCAYRSLGDCRDGSDARSTGTFDVDVIR